MKKTMIPILLVILLILVIVLLPIISTSHSNSNETDGGSNTNVSYPNATKVAVILPHPDDETIGMGGTLQKIMDNGTTVHCELMTSGDAITSQLLPVYNYYKIGLPANSSADYQKKLIREDSFKRVMAIYGCNYNIEGYDDGSLNADRVFKTMENLYLNEGYTMFYTTTGDGNGDHLACSQGMKKMMEKYPNLKYRQFPIYWYHTSRPAPSPIKDNGTNVDISKYTTKKKSAFQVFYNINTIIPIFYPYSDGLYSISPEKIYYLN